MLVWVEPNDPHPWRRFMPEKKLTCRMAFALILTSTALMAQMGTGRITGVVTDVQGNNVVGAVINVVDATGKKLTATSDEDGKWAILGFRTGTYDFNVTAEGYQPKIEQKAVTQLGENTLNIVLVPLIAAKVNEEDDKLLKEANRLLREKQYAEAITNYQALLVAQPEFYQIHEYIGVAYRELGDFDSALAEFNEVLEVDANHAPTLISIGDILVAQQKLEEAVVYFEKAVAQTTDAVVPYNVAEIYFTQGNAVKAIEYYQKAAEYRTDWADPHLKLGYAYLNTGDIEGAKTAFQKVVEIAPDTPQAQMAQAALSSLQ
jgi:tetratricopeptide (TPR) repeat protein